MNHPVKQVKNMHCWHRTALKYTVAVVSVVRVHSSDTLVNATVLLECI